MATTREYDIGPFTYPRGWFMVADAEEITTTPKSERFFGQDVVIYRGESGRVFMVDAYCPHMGTHLGKNTTSYVIQDKIHVEGDNIRCPYHAWRFGPDGKCNQIPYFDGPIPAGAKIKTWKVVERYGCIFTWHDPEGGEPDVDLPEIKAWEDPQFVHWKLDRLGTINCHPVEIIDNMADVAHLGPTHGGPCEFFRNEIVDHVIYQYQGGKHRTITDGGLLETFTYYTGPGILISEYNGGNQIMFITHTPVDDGVVKAWHALLVKAPNKIPTEQDIQDARTAQAYALHAFAQDFEIWSNKAPCFQHLTIPADGAFGKVRQWYKQFYHPRALTKELQSRANGTYPVRGMPSDSSAVA